MCIYIYIVKCLCICIYVYVCVRCICMCMCTVYVYIYIYICTTYRQRFQTTKMQAHADSLFFVLARYMAPRRGGAGGAGVEATSSSLGQRTFFCVFKFRTFVMFDTFQCAMTRHVKDRFCQFE